MPDPAYVGLLAALYWTLSIGLGPAATFAGSSPRQPTPLTEMARRAVARIDGEIALPGLEAPVRVVRDRWGVPHIYASSTNDLFFAQGYVTAQDRLWQMEMWRRSAEGRSSEILGPEARLPR